jgi:type IV pilus assembly protein PilQ
VRVCQFRHSGSETKPDHSKVRGVGQPRLPDVSYDGFMGAVLLVLALAAAGAEEAKVSIDVRDAAVVDVIRVLAEVGSFQTVVDPGVHCSLTLKLNGVRWVTALDLSLRACGLAREEEGGIVRIATPARLIEESADRRKLDEDRAAARPKDLRLVRLSYARAESLAPLLKRLLSPHGDVTYDARTNTLLIVD